MSVVALVVRSTLVLLIALGAESRLRRARPEARHQLWLAAFLALTLLPLAGTLAPALELPGAAGLTAPLAAAERAVQRLGGVAVAPASGDQLQARASGPLANGRGAPRIAREDLARAATGLYLLVALALLARGIGRLWRAHLAVRRARPLPPGSPWRASWRSVLAELERPPSAARLVMSDEVAAPATCGLRRPAVLIPAAAGSWPAELRRAALRHELAHVQRRDWAIQQAVGLLCALYWFQPLVWLAAARLRLEAERACDRRVVAAGASPLTYAGQLVRLVRRRPPSRALADLPGLVGRSELARRVESLLATPAGLIGTAGGAGRILVATGAGLLLALVPIRWGEAATAAELVPSTRVEKSVPGEATALIRAVALGSPESVARLLERGADPNEHDTRRRRPSGLQRSALGEAALHGRLEIVDLLLAAGAAVDEAPRGDATPLMAAAAHGHRAVVERLLERGADPDRVVERDGTPLIAAVRGGDREIVARLLAAGASIDRGVEGDGNPLIAAVQEGDRGMVELLLAAGADPNVSVPGDDTPLENALEQGDRAIARLLSAAGADR